MHKLAFTLKSIVCFLYTITLLCVAQLPAQESSLIPDPYIWLEDSDHPQTKQWLEHQKHLFDQYIQSNSGREKFKEKIAKLVSYEAYSIPTQMGEDYFFTRRLPSEEQAVLYLQKGINGIPRALINPNQLSKAFPLALTDYVPSPNGQYLAYGIAANGSDWVTWKILNISSTGENQTDQLERIKFFPVAWTPDSLGFYYSRIDHDDIQRIYYHCLGTSQDLDQLVNQPFQSHEFFVVPFISSDRQFLMIHVMKGSSGPNAVLYRNLNDPNAPFETIMPLKESNYSYLGSKGSHFYFWTNQDAPLGKVIAIDKISKSSQEVIKEGAYPLSQLILLGNYFAVIYSENVISRLFLFDLEGRELKEIALPEMGQVSFLEMEWLSSQPAEEFFFSFTHFVQPQMIYHYSLKSQQLQVFKKPDTCFDPSEYLTRQVFCHSKDGTKVPIFIVHKKDLQLEEPYPTMLYGYGGFGASIYPHYNSLHMAWIENGGIFALANIRGGAEYGEEWHKGGMGKNKQNCFDDFIAAAEWLIANRYTNSSKLAILGRSNGGLLTAVCLNQRPELFGAVVVGVGVLDMLRFPLFTVGRFWMSEYGNPQDPQDFEILRRYSPYHNIRAGNHYPSTLITTADHDDRVVPLHSYKYAAAMQEAQEGVGKILLRIERQAGHGAGKSISQWIEEAADILLFLKNELNYRQKR